MNDLLKPTKIIRSKRKSISLIIEHNGDFVVRAPNKTAEEEIYKFINEKQHWIMAKRTQQLNHAFKPLLFIDNEQITILGTTYSIKIKENCNVKVADNIIYLPKNQAKDKLIKYLKKLAKKVIKEELNDIVNAFGFSYLNLTINSAKTHWGSCSGSDKLHFSYKLMLCPMDVVDYVIIHELCHTKVKNHSNKFWCLVAKYYPDYKLCEKWLKENRAIVELI